LRLTQRQLSQRTGIGLRLIRELEQGKKTARADKINQLLQFFGHQLGPIPMDVENDE